jgi:hypothetical protein
MSARLMSFKEAQAFQHCDLIKGRNFVEPMRSTFAPTLSPPLARVIDHARNDAMDYACGGAAPYNYYTNETAFTLYGTVARDAIDLDRTPYTLMKGK